MKSDRIREYIYGFIRRGIKYNLEKITRLMELLGDPHEKLQWIHVTGTNGKGSVCAMLESMLAGKGLRTGVFSSPHLVDVNERFRIDGAPADDDTLEEVLRRLDPAVRRMEEEPGVPSFFEITMAVATLLFEGEGVDAAIAEVGLGGRLDATNIIHPLAAVLTNVSLDHPKTLGGTLSNICREKCGIIKRGVPVISGVEEEELRRIVREEAKRRGASSLYEVPSLTRIEGIRTSRDPESPSGVSTTFTLEMERYGPEGPPWRGEVRVPLAGAHQARNASVALAAIGMLPERLRPPIDEAVRHLGRTFWPGRFQICTSVRGGMPEVVLDAGHNAAGLESTTATWKAVYGDECRPVVLVGFSADKDVARLLGLLERISDCFVCTASGNYRAIPAEELERLALEVLPGDEVRSALLPDALRTALELGGERSVPLLICGSLYLLGEVIPVLEEEGYDILRWTRA